VERAADTQARTSHVNRAPRCWSHTKLKPNSQSTKFSPGAGQGSCRAVTCTRPCPHWPLHALACARRRSAGRGRAAGGRRSQPKLLTVNARFNIPDIYSPWAFFRTSSRDITCARGPAAVATATVRVSRLERRIKSDGGERIGVLTRGRRRAHYLWGRRSGLISQTRATA
jgi:hypothetical protein